MDKPDVETSRSRLRFGEHACDETSRDCVAARIAQDEDEAEAQVEDRDPLSWRLQTGLPDPAPNPTPDPDPDPLSDSVPSEYSDEDAAEDVFAANGLHGRNGERPRLESAPAVLLEALSALPSPPSGIN